MGPPDVVTTSGGQPLVTKGVTVATSVIATDDQVFNYAIQPKPTVYEGRLFRSNLEATWAAFFDLMNWEWEYEPIVLEGWIPDFHVTIDQQDYLCEVKPMQRSVHLPTCQKMIAANPGGNLLFLGSNLEPRFIDVGDVRWRIGWVTPIWGEFLVPMTPNCHPMAHWNHASALTKIKGRYW